MLAAMVKRWGPERGTSHAPAGETQPQSTSPLGGATLFLDRDPTLFSVILQCLRSPGIDAGAMAVQGGLDLASLAELS